MHYTRYVSLGLVVLGVLLPGCVSVQPTISPQWQGRSLKIVGVYQSSGPEADVATIETKLAASLIRCNIQVVERSELEKTIRERNLGASGVSTFQELSKLHGVEALVSVSTSGGSLRIGGGYETNVKVIDPQTGTMIALYEGSSTDRYKWKEPIEQIGASLCAQFGARER